MFITKGDRQIWVDDVKFVHMLIKDFRLLSAELDKYGMVASLGGDGLLKYLNELEMPVKFAEIRANEVLERLPVEGPNMLKGAEIGVFVGDMSKYLLARPDITLMMVDSWNSEHTEDYVKSGDFHSDLTQEEQDRYYEMARNAVRFAGDRAALVKSDSVNAAELVDDGSLDFVFIDADHSYEGCKKDLNAWFPKIKSGGLFSGHDYNNTEFPDFGVKQAVDEFVASKGLVLALGDNFTWFVTLP